MAAQEIDVVIDAAGKVTVHVMGVPGMACLDITAALEAALGGQIESREMTPDAYQPVAVEAAEQQPVQGA